MLCFSLHIRQRICSISWLAKADQRKPARLVSGGLYAFMQEKINKFLEWKATYHVPASIKYRKPIERFADVCGDKLLHKYTIEDIVLYNRWLSRQFSNETVRYALTILKHFFNFYHSQHVKCLSSIFIAMPKKLPAHSHRAITEEEVRRMIREIEGESFISYRNLLILLMLWDTGIRVTELCRMQISDLDLQKRQAVIATEKRQIMRIILWSESTNIHLIKYLEIHKRHFENVGDRDIPLFVSSRSKKKIECLTRETVERIVSYYARKAGIKKKTTPHTFRHGWAHVRRDLGAPLSFVQKGLGHASPISTQVYQQFTDPEFVRAGKEYFSSPYSQPQPQYIAKEIMTVPTNMNLV